VIGKCLRVLASVVVTVLLIATPAIAASSVDISITAAPISSAGILTFTVTYVSDTRIDLEWTVDPTVDKVMVRGKYGEYPHDIPNEDVAPTDGYEVYYGFELSTVDTSMNFDTNPGPLYYKAWAQKPDGHWYVTPATGFKESTGMILLALCGLALGLTVAMFLSRNPMLGFPAGLFWAVLGGYAYTMSTTPWGDWQFFLAIASLLGMLPFCAFGAYGLREKKDTGTDEDEYIDERGGGREHYYGEARQTSYRESVAERQSPHSDDLPSDHELDRPTRPSARTRMLRRRAAERKTGNTQKRTSWGEFK